jgi:hypothetical protein
MGIVAVVVLCETGNGKQDVDVQGLQGCRQGAGLRPGGAAVILPSLTFGVLAEMVPRRFLLFVVALLLLAASLVAVGFGLRSGCPMWVARPTRRNRLLLPGPSTA